MAAVTQVIKRSPCLFKTAAEDVGGFSVAEDVGGLFKAEDVGEDVGGSLAVRVAGPEGPRVTPQSVALAVPEPAT